MTFRIPWISLAFLGLTLSAAAAPTIATLLIYDRVAVDRGEFWRLFTCHFVHFSPSHLFWNLAVIVAVAGMLEMQRSLRWRPPLAMALLIIGPALHALEPDMQRYCGLSGLATAMTVCLCLSKIQYAKEAKWVWAATLTLLAGKLFIEFRVPSPLFATANAIEFQVVPLAHLIGAAIGFLCLAMRRPFEVSSKSVGLPAGVQEPELPRAA